ncbi:MAG TPA: DUF2231 domain-containing protein [Vicinamibacteria bacterium]|jgi:uncharacterized membrane protein
MTTPASFKGHPIHVILVAYPIGLWTFSLVCDVVYRMGWGGEAWADAALYTLGGGIVGALLAAVPGLIDLLSLADPAVKKVGILHMAVNLGAVAVFGFGFLLRLGGNEGVFPVLLSLAGVIAIGISGWLGGELVYAHGVGVQAAPPGPAPGGRP